MTIGDVVIVRKSATAYSGKTGIILDQIDDDMGFKMCEVLIEGEVEWLYDLDLKVISESR